MIHSDLAVAAYGTVTGYVGGNIWELWSLKSEYVMADYSVTLLRVLLEKPSISLNCMRHISVCFSLMLMFLIHREKVLGTSITSYLDHASFKKCLVSLFLA